MQYRANNSTAFKLGAFAVVPLIFGQSKGSNATRGTVVGLGVADVNVDDGVVEEAEVDETEDVVEEPDDVVEETD